MPPKALLDHTTAYARKHHGKTHVKETVNGETELARNVERLIAVFMTALSDRQGHTYAKLVETHPEIREVIKSLAWSKQKILAVLQGYENMLFKKMSDGRIMLAIRPSYQPEGGFQYPENSKSATVSKTNGSKAATSTAEGKVNDSDSETESSDSSADRQASTSNPFAPTSPNRKRVIRTHPADDDEQTASIKNSAWAPRKPELRVGSVKNTLSSSLTKASAKSPLFKESLADKARRQSATASPARSASRRAVSASAREDTPVHVTASVPSLGADEGRSSPAGSSRNESTGLRQSPAAHASNTTSTRLSAKGKERALDQDSTQEQALADPIALTAAQDSHSRDNTDFTHMRNVSADLNIDEVGDSQDADATQGSSVPKSAAHTTETVEDDLDRPRQHSMQYEELDDDSDEASASVSRPPVQLPKATLHTFRVPISPTLSADFVEDTQFVQPLANSLGNSFDAASYSQQLDDQNAWSINAEKTSTGDLHNTAPLSDHSDMADTTVVPADDDTTADDPSGDALVIATDIPVATGSAPFRKSRRRDDKPTSAGHRRIPSTAATAATNHTGSLDENNGDGDQGEEHDPSNMRNLSPQSKRRERERILPAPLLDGYGAARAAGGHAIAITLSTEDETSTRASSAVAQDDDELLQVDSLAPTSFKPTKAARKRSVAPDRTQTREASLRPPEDEEDDVVFVAARPHGAPPEPPRKTKAEREQERLEKEKRREERRARKRKKPLPTFRHTIDEEHEELMEAYRIRKEQITQMGTPEVSSWEVMCSYEEPKGTNRSTTVFNSVKFWPYHLPYPGRLENEAIVAVAGGCLVRCFRLSEERGVQELWCAVDESSEWPKEEYQENFHTLDWTYEIRDDPDIDATWRKWPLLLVAGRGKEIKVLDGYAGTTAKIIQGHGADITCLAVHPALPHVVATASIDESISLWDISVPVTKPDAIPKYGNEAEEGKRRKPYAEGERLCVYGGYGGHVEAAFSVAFHPCLPLIASGGVDCKLRIWRLPAVLPLQPLSRLLKPISVPLPESSKRPPCISFPIYTHDSLHSHHIDHVAFIGSDGTMLTRSSCFDSPGKRVIRIFRPKFFEHPQMALELDCLGADLILPSDVQMIARWTVAGCSENIGDGGACLASEIEFDKVTHQFRNRSRLYVPSTEPMIHAYDVDIRSIQPDLDAQKQQYKTKVGDEIIRDIDDTKDCQLRALACQTGGSGWLVGVGELEKFCVWKRKSSSNLKIRDILSGRAQALQNGHTNGHTSPEPLREAEEPAFEETYMISESIYPVQPAANGHASPNTASIAYNERSPSVEYV